MVHPGGGQALTPGSLTSSSEDAAIAAIKQLAAAASVSVKVRSYRPDELRFEATLPEKGWLLITDRWSRGWHATVNGRPTDVFAANFIFRAVAVEAGSNDVHFTYTAVGFPLFVILSWSTIFLTLACRSTAQFDSSCEARNERSGSVSRALRLERKHSSNICFRAWSSG